MIRDLEDKARSREWLFGQVWILVSAFREQTSTVRMYNCTKLSVAHAMRYIIDLAKGSPSLSEEPYGCRVSGELLVNS